MQETLDKTSLRGVRPGDRVNLERAVTADNAARRPHRPGPRRRRRRDPCAATPSEHWEVVEISLPDGLGRYLVDKGSITVDGVTLTVVEAGDDSFTVSLIPETLARTTLGFRQAGDLVNLEVGRHRQVRREAARQRLPRPPPEGEEPVTETQGSRVRLDTVERAIADIAAGKAVVVVDDEDRENEGDIIFAASKATPELMAFTIRHSSGVICVPMPADMLDRLEIPLMTPHNKDKLRTAYTISVDARDGVSTGISAADRAHTARVLADSATEPWEITRPGHVFPLRYREGGVLVRRGHTEAAVDLARMAGLTPAGVLVEVVNDDGTMKRAPRAARVRRRARPGDDLDRGAGAATAAATSTWSSGSPRPACPPGTATSRRTATAITVDDSEHVALVYGDITGDEPRADPGAQRVPDRRRVRLPPLRLRPAARRGARADRRGGPRRRGLPARPRGPGDRPGRQAAGLPAPGRRPRHRRRQPRPRAARRRPALRHRDPDPARPRRRAASGC